MTVALSLGGDPGGTSLSLGAEPSPDLGVVLSLGGPVGGTALHIGVVWEPPTGEPDQVTGAALTTAPTAAGSARVNPYAIAAAVTRATGTAQIRVNPHAIGAAVARATAGGRVEQERFASGAALTYPPTAAGDIQHTAACLAAATTVAPTAVAATEYDINLPQVTASCPVVGCWIPGSLAALWHRDPLTQATTPAPAVAICHAEADPARQGPPICHQQSERSTGAARLCETDAVAIRQGSVSRYDNAEAARYAITDCAQQAGPERGGTTTRMVNLDRATAALDPAWRDAAGLGQWLTDPQVDGDPLRVPLIGCWQHGRLPHTWIRPTPVDPPYYPPQPPIRLALCGEPGLTALHLGREPCLPLNRRYYLMINTATLTLLDGTPLPATAVSIRTDCDSWAWALSATLAGSDAYALVAPDPLTFAPKEVLAEVNGWEWRFVLDEPRHSRQFGKTAVALSGRSRTAYLTAPYWVSTSGTNSAPLTMAQAAEHAVDSTGFSVDWSSMPDWTIPAGVLNWDGTPIERLSQLAAPTDGCLLSHRTSAQLLAYPRYPARPINWDDLALDHSIPESAIVKLERSDDTRTRYNAVWISGTTHGCLADCWITGTAADQRAPDIADVLLCDSAGVAARARAISVLGQAGPGWTLTASTLLQRPESAEGPRLVTPGDVVSFGGDIVLCRGVSITAQWSGEALGVRQSITLEQRAQEY